MRVALLCLIAATPAWSSPIVPAYERFHAGDSSAAGGRLLLTELSCTACHDAPPAADLPPKKGPVLDGVGVRVAADWMQAFLADPHSAKPGTTMPDVLGALPEAQRKDAVESLVHLLASATKVAGKTAEKLPGNVSADRGMLLFREIGCIGCHAAPGDALGARASSPAIAAGDATSAAKASPPAGGDARSPIVPLPDLAAKYSLESLARFLKSPLDHRSAGRMPDFMLDMQEAVDIAGYLIGHSDVKSSNAPKLPAFKSDPKRVAEGRKLFVSLGCTNCHTLEGTAAVAKGKPLADLAAWDRGCVSNGPHRGDSNSAAPRFSLSAQQAKSIALAVTAPPPDKPADRVVATMQKLNCYACHQRDNLGGVDPAIEKHFTGDPDLADEGRFPPKLTGVGRKLTPDWLAKVFGREGRMRPYLRMRMPVFGADAVKHLPADLIAADGGMKDQKALAGGDVEAGRKLLGAAGLSCITCHGLQGRPSIGIHALDITKTTQRLQPAWFRENLLNPTAVRPGTLMPTFWPEGKAANTEILGGDTDKQIAAIWAYLREGKTPVEGYPPAKGEFELVADEKPVILRCFMEQAGTHAIAVGFPQKVHVAFDANTIRPAIAWRGKFLDAYTTWFSRNQPPVTPLGDAMVTLPAAMPLAKLKSPTDAWPKTQGAEAGYTFGGYRLDKDGVPTFLYRFGDIAVEDRLTPTPDGKGLVRTLTLRGNGEGVYFRPHSLATPDATPILVRFQQGVATLEMEYKW